MMNRKKSTFIQPFYSPVQLMLEMKKEQRNSQKKEFAPFVVQRDGLGRLIKNKEKLITPINIGTKVKSQQNTESSVRKAVENEFSLLTEKCDNVDGQILRCFEFKDPRQIKIFDSSRLSNKKKSLATTQDDHETPINKENFTNDPIQNKKFQEKERGRSEKVPSTRARSNTTDLPQVLLFKKIGDDNCRKSDIKTERKSSSRINLRKFSESHSQSYSLMPLIKGKPNKIGVSSIPTHRKWPKLNDNIEESHQSFKQKMLEFKQKAIKHKLNLGEQ